MKSEQGFLFCGLLAILAITPFVYLKGIFYYSTVPKAAFIQVGLIVISILFVFWSTINDIKLKLIKSPLNIAILLFFAYTLFSAISAHNKYESLTTWSFWVSGGVLFFMFQQLQLTEEAIKKLIFVIYISGVAVAVIGLLQHLFHFSFIPQTVSPSSTFANKNMAAQFIVLTLPLSIALFKEKPLLIAVGNTFMFHFLFFTSCKAAWLAVLVVSACLFLFFSLRCKKKVLITIEVVLLVLSVAFALKTHKTISAYHRLMMWSNTIEMIKDNPVTGVGVGNFKIYYPKYQRLHTIEDDTFNERTQIERVHNDLLQFVAETGLIGLAILACCVSLLSFDVIKALRKNDESFYIILGLSAAVVSISINSMFSFPGYLPTPVLFVFTYIAVLFHYFEKDSVHFPKSFGGLLAICMALTLFYTASYHYNNILQDKHRLYIKFFEKNRNWKNVVLLSTAAYPLNTHNKKILAFTGRACLELGNIDKGIEILETASGAYPYSMNTLLNLGVGYSRAGDDNKALECFDRVLDIKPDFAKAYVNIGLSRLKLNQRELAVVAFEKAKAINPEYFIIEQRALNKGEIR